MCYFLVSLLFILNSTQKDFSNKSKLIFENNLPVSQRFQIKEGELSEYSISSTRDEDTLVLDDGTVFSHRNYNYSAQKFTPGVLCTLKSTILRTSLTSIQCSLFIWNDSSGVPQSSLNLVSPIYFVSSGPGVWQRIDLPAPLVIDKDFWIGIYDLSQSSMICDYTQNCHNRFALSNDKIDWWVLDYHRFGEFLIRPIVTLTGPRHDVSCTNIFSKRGFFLPNPAFDTVGVVVKNFGNVKEENIPVYLRVTDSLGLLIFFDVQYIDSLKHNEIDTLFIPWNYTGDGDFIIEGYPWLANDCVRDNDRLEIESYIRTYPCELYYDDPESFLRVARFDSIANKFFPPYYPCKIESVKCFFIAPPVESTYTYGIASVILDDDGPEGFPGTEIAKDSVQGLVGPNWFQWLTIDFSNHNVVFETGGFFIEWTCIPDSTTPPYPNGPTLWADWDNPPFAMMTWVKGGGIWYHYWEHFDAIIRVCVDYPSAVSKNNEKKSDFSNSLSVHPTISSGKFKCSFCTSSDEIIKISIYSIDGRRIKNLFNSYVKKGLHYFYTDISDLPQGIYFICMKGNGFSEKKKFVLIK